MASPAGDRVARFASGFGRFSVVLSVVGLLVALALSLPASWLAIGGRDTGDRPAYTDPTPAAPVRVSVGGLSGVQLVAPLVSSGAEPREALLTAPVDAPLVSWLSHTAKAGAPHGQTVLVGHAGPGGGGLSPIAGLGQGDFVELLTKQGTMRYEVDTVRTLGPATMERVGLQLFKQDGGAGRLVMVSAEGWDGSAYQRSVVVTARPLGEPVG